MSRIVDDYCLVISYYVFVSFTIGVWNVIRLKLRFLTNVGTERGQASLPYVLVFMPIVVKISYRSRCAIGGSY